MLKELHLRNVGPAPAFNIEFGKRLNLFTGDNGLGKTFLLDVMWWALTGTWAGRPAWPQRQEGEPTIAYNLIGEKGKVGSVTSEFEFQRQLWTRPETRVSMPALVVYVRIDGGFSIWDPARNTEGLSIPLSVPVTPDGSPHM